MLPYRETPLFTILLLRCVAATGAAETGHYRAIMNRARLAPAVAEMPLVVAARALGDACPVVARTMLSPPRPYRRARLCTLASRPQPVAIVTITPIFDFAP